MTPSPFIVSSHEGTMRSSGYVLLPDATRIGAFKASVSEGTIRVEAVDTDLWFELALTPSITDSMAQEGVQIPHLTLASSMIRASCAEHGIFCTYFIKDRVFVFQCDGPPSRAFWVECSSPT